MWVGGALLACRTVRDIRHSGPSQRKHTKKPEQAAITGQTRKESMLPPGQKEVILSQWWAVRGQKIHIQKEKRSFTEILGINELRDV